MRLKYLHHFNLYFNITVTLVAVLLVLALFGKWSTAWIAALCLGLRRAPVPFMPRVSFYLSGESLLKSSALKAFFNGPASPRINPSHANALFLMGAWNIKKSPHTVEGGDALLWSFMLKRSDLHRLLMCYIKQKRDKSRLLASHIIV